MRRKENFSGWYSGKYTNERPEPAGPPPSGRTPIQETKRPAPPPAPPNIFADMWNIPAIQAAAPEMYRVLQRNLNDLEYIDYMCDSLGFPRFEVMRKEIEEVLEKARENK